jgi:DNA-binding response OmpR family regulator
MKKILVVDDHPKIRELVSVTFSELGNYEVYKAENGKRALDIVGTEKPDLILLDIEMPGGLSGFEVAEIIRANPETKLCVIIFLTAKGQEADKEQGWSIGADDYFIKPFNPTNLIRKVDELLK